MVQNTADVRALKYLDNASTYVHSQYLKMNFPWNKNFLLAYLFFSYVVVYLFAGVSVRIQNSVKHSLNWQTHNVQTCRTTVNPIYLLVGDGCFDTQRIVEY